MNGYLNTFRKYAVFSGRARRREYWTFIIVNMLIVLLLSRIDQALGSHNALGVIFGLVAFLPALAVAVRRLHDTDRSGWWLLFGLLPLVGALVLLFFKTRNGDAGSNQYGADPKAGA